jgi:hypothetical protein
MPRRTPESLADYLVVAICPALIMLLVGSLMFFLVEVFYQGQFELRLYWVLAMFVMGIVCLTRIAMEEGFGYASLYAVPLGFLVGIALARFVHFGGPLAPYSLVVNWGLMAWVWWCAHKLTWDSTLIEDTQDASGQGLLQHMRLEADPRSQREPSPAARQSPPDEATSSLHPAARNTLAWWKSWLEADRRPHPAGIWVVYFSLGALPLFGLGGRLLAVDDLDARRRCFWLLVIYVASAMCLLLATSFLGLRKYLRQRRLEMPLDMTAVWIGAGVVMIVATLIVASLVPRPSPEYSLAQLVDIDSLDRRASQYAFGPEGGKDDPDNPSQSGADQREGQQAQKEGGGKTDKRQGTGDSGQESGDRDSGDKGQGTQDGGKSQSGGKQGQQSSGDKAHDSGTKQPGEGKTGDEKPGNESEDKSADQQRGSKDNQQSDSTDESAQQGEQQSRSDDSQGTQSKSSGQTAGQRLLSQTQSWFGSLGELLKALIYLALAIAAAFLAWKYRRELLAAWKKLLDELRNLWESWFGKAAKTEPVSSEPASVPRPFAQFSDPFAGGQSSRMSPAELVRYTFQALEAWGRENGCPRAEGQTPHEFAAAIGQLDHTLASEAAHLADLYARLAYAPPAAIRTTFEPLRSLWRKMTSPAVTIV